MPTIRAAIFQSYFNSCHAEASAAHFEHYLVRRRVLLQSFLNNYKHYFKSIKISQPEPNFAVKVSRSNSGTLFTPISNGEGMISITCWLSVLSSDFSLTFELDAADFEQSLPLLVSSLKQSNQNSLKTFMSVCNVFLLHLQKSYISFPARSLLSHQNVLSDSKKQFEVKFDQQWRVNGLTCLKEITFVAILWIIQKTYSATAMEVIRSIFPEAKLGRVRAPFEKTVIIDKNVRLGDFFDNRPFATMIESAAGLSSMVSMAAFAPHNSIRIASAEKGVFRRGEVFCIFMAGSVTASFGAFSRFFKDATIFLPMPLRPPGLTSLSTILLIHLIITQLPFPNFIDCDDRASLPDAF